HRTLQRSRCARCGNRNFAGRPGSGNQTGSFPETGTFATGNSEKDLFVQTFGLCSCGVEKYFRPQKRNHLRIGNRLGIRNFTTFYGFVEEKIILTPALSKGEGAFSQDKLE